MLEPSRQLGPKSPSQDPPAAPGQWRVCPGPQGSTSGEGRSFGGPAGLPTALVWPDPLATPRVTVWPQPPDLLGPREAPTGPGNPIPLGALRGGCLGPQGQVRGQPSRSPGSPAAPPTSAPSLRWGWVPARSPSLSRSLLSTYWMPRLQPMAAQAGLGGVTWNPGRQTWGRGCGQGCPGRGGGGRTTSHQQPVGPTGRHPEVGWRGPPAGHSGETRRRGRKGDGHEAETQGQQPGGRSHPHPCRGLGTGVGPARSAPGRPWSRPDGGGSPGHLEGGPLRSILARARPGCCAGKRVLKRALAEGCPPGTLESPHVPEKVHQPPSAQEGRSEQWGCPSAAQMEGPSSCWGGDG